MVRFQVFLDTNTFGWGLLLMLVTIVFTAVAPLPGKRPALRLHCLVNILLWAILAITYLPWMWFLCGMVGWVYIWGDNQSPELVAYQDAVLPSSVMLAAGSAGIAVLRTAMEWATWRYLQLLIGLEAALLLWTVCFLVPKIWR